MISKLGKQYNTVEPEGLLTGADYKEIDTIFAGRLAYLAKINGTTFKLTEGYRTPERQRELYAQYQNYLKTGKGNIKLAEKPTMSWHEWRLAVDTSSQPIRAMTNDQLKPYGLCKPIKSEGWHIQPIETMGISDRKKYAPEGVEDMTREETIKLIKEILNGDNTEPSAWAKDEIEQAKKKGITDGTRPQGYATRQEVAIMILRGLK